MRGRWTTCCFTGHRPNKLPWGKNEQDERCIAAKAKLNAVVRNAIEEGFEHFICGMAIGADFYFCETVIALRKEFPHITLEAAIPCLAQSDHWAQKDRERYRDLLAQCDMETLVQESYSRDCMQRRNRYMVDHSALLIAMHDGLPGGTRNTITYAIKQRISIVDIPLF